MHQEGLLATPRLDYIVRHVLAPVFETFGGSLVRLQEAGLLRPVTSREIFFLVAHGAGAPYTLTALSEAFDIFDGPLDPEHHADAMTDLIMRGIALDGPPAGTAGPAS